MYYEQTTDSNYVAKHPEKIFVTRSGWQQAGIDLYNELYVKVKEDRAINGKVFNIHFRKMINESIDRIGAPSSFKRKPKNILPCAMNDL